jgi:hypothetical protein
MRGALRALSGWMLTVLFLVLTDVSFFCSGKNVLGMKQREPSIGAHAHVSSEVGRRRRRRKKEEGRKKEEEGRRKKEEGR